MPTATYDADVYEDGQQFKDDARLMVRFYMQAIQNHFETEQQGRPVFVDIPYIEVITPGSRDTLVTEATVQYQNRFRRQWENFKSRTEPSLVGTPLAEIPWLTVSQVAELNAMNVKTVEQLVNLPDVLAQKVMGSHQLRERAKRFLEAAAGESVNLKLEGQLRERDDKITDLTTMLGDMKAEIDKLKAKKA